MSDRRKPRTYNASLWCKLSGGEWERRAGQIVVSPQRRQWFVECTPNNRGGYPLLNGALFIIHELVPEARTAEGACVGDIQLEHRAR